MSGRARSVRLHDDVGAFEQRAELFGIVHVAQVQERRSLADRRIRQHRIDLGEPGRGDP
jgi:hypothetical protein